MSLKRCTECKKVVSTGSHFCVHCGYTPASSCHTCVDYCCPGDDTPKRPVCYNIHHACPAYIYDDPWAIAEAKKKKKVLR